MVPGLTVDHRPRPTCAHCLRPATEQDEETGELLCGICLPTPPDEPDDDEPEYSIDDLRRGITSDADRALLDR